MRPESMRGIQPLFPLPLFFSAKHCAEVDQHLAASLFTGGKCKPTTTFGPLSVFFFSLFTVGLRCCSMACRQRV